MTTARNGTAQLMLDFEPGLVDRHDSLLSVINECIGSNLDNRKTIAANLGMAPSMLNRKINLAADQDPDQRRIFNVEDLDRYFDEYRDFTAIYYLAEKYLQDDTSKTRHALARLDAVLPELQALAKTLRGETATPTRRTKR